MGHAQFRAVKAIAERPAPAPAERILLAPIHSQRESTKAIAL
jgi:hypothetical protein